MEYKKSDAQKTNAQVDTVEKQRCEGLRKGKRGQMERKKIQSSQSTAPSDDHSARG